MVIIKYYSSLNNHISNLITNESLNSINNQFINPIGNSISDTISKTIKPFTQFLSNPNNTINNYSHNSIFDSFNNFLASTNFTDIIPTEATDNLEVIPKSSVNSATSGNLANALGLEQGMFSNWLKGELTDLWIWFVDITEPLIDFGLLTYIAGAYVIWFLSNHDVKSKTFRRLCIAVVCYVSYWLLRGLGGGVK